MYSINTKLLFIRHLRPTYNKQVHSTIALSAELTVINNEVYE
jgi:hypothetical protein